VPNFLSFQGEVFGEKQKTFAETKCIFMFSTVFPRFGLSNNFAHRNVLLTANPKPFDSQATRV